MDPLGQGGPRVQLRPGPVPVLQPQAGAVAQQVLGVPGHLVRRGEGDRPFEVLVGVAVLADLEGDGGQVDQRPGGVVLEPGRDRHLERLFQLGSPALVTLVEVD